MKKRSTFFFVLIALSCSIRSQSWVDSVDRHGREIYMPADKYKWDWGQATFMNALVHMYNASLSDNKKNYLDYIKRAMEVSRNVANGKHPNAVASAHGIAFLARVTGDETYKEWASRIYDEYLQIPRTQNGGVSHRAETLELWDDTVYMLGMFLLEMYRLTGDEKYLTELWHQYDVHNKELIDAKSGLWVHGWDADSVFYDDGCSVKNWPDKETHRNDQIWARGNGWVGMVLADAVEATPQYSSYRKKFEKALQHFASSVAPFQDHATGHWYQLVTVPDLPKNFLESSCTAMYAYAIIKGVRLKVLDRKKYLPFATRAYHGLRNYSMRQADGHMVPTRVSGGTCVGDQQYYLNRKIMEGTGFGYGSFIMFGLEYEQFTELRK